jgi:choline dehydrogenase-like flavoprotein
VSDTAAFDAIIVGSGAAGGMAACELSREGLRVLMLEAGRNHDPETETPMLHIQEIAPLRSVSTMDKPNGFYDATVDGGPSERGMAGDDVPRRDARRPCGAAPSAPSAMGIVDFIDDWVSAPYETQRKHRTVIEDGLAMVDDELRKVVT